MQNHLSFLFKTILNSLFFNEDGSYLIDYGSQTEKGIFEIDGQKRYTREEEQAKKFVEITKLTPDSLQFKMNRAGRMETVLLVK